MALYSVFNPFTQVEVNSTIGYILQYPCHPTNANLSTDLYVCVWKVVDDKDEKGKPRRKWESLGVFPITNLNTTGSVLQPPC